MFVHLNHSSHYLFASFFILFFKRLNWFVQPLLCLMSHHTLSRCQGHLSIPYLNVLSHRPISDRWQWLDSFALFALFFGNIWNRLVLVGVSCRRRRTGLWLCFSIRFNGVLERRKYNSICYFYHTLWWFPPTHRCIRALILVHSFSQKVLCHVIALLLL